MKWETPKLIPLNSFMAHGVCEVGSAADPNNPACYDGLAAQARCGGGPGEIGSGCGGGNSAIGAVCNTGGIAKGGCGGGNTAG